MNSNNIHRFFDQYPCILGEGAVIERLRRSGSELDPQVVNSAFIYDDDNRLAIETIYRQYLDIGFEYNLPLVLSTPTWRASRERIETAGYGSRDLNGDNFRFLDALRASYGLYTQKVVICGLLSCRGNAYHPDEALGAEEACLFHAWQAERLAEAGVDFLLAATLPALSEAIGLAAALARTGTPYVVSFVVRPEGTLLDGTPLKQALAAIEDAVNPGPMAFMANCTHASFLKSALVHREHSSSHVRERIVGLFANTAALTPEALDNSESLVEEDPEAFGRAVAGLHADFGLKVLGGCCGTDDRHIRSLAMRLAS
ncbi:MAG: homocysteine S-methyltransferase family protein [Desulfobacterales bacterium]|nr:MAG: homocysteine S-methyltransferase family protein [Desulfobacterales bacterium]